MSEPRRDVSADDQNADVWHPAEAFERLWARGDPPELKAFLSACAPLPPQALADVLRVDMQRRWPSEQRGAEYYLAHFPEVAADTDGALDLAFQEFLLSERDRPDLDIDAFVGRFPELAAALRAQIELHRALGPQSRDNPTRAAPLTTIDGAPLDIDADDPATWPLPRQFGRYRLQRVLGRGGMGTVFLAFDEQLNRQVAVKMPRFDGANSEGGIQRFYREARIAANLLHPNLCPIHDIGQWHGRHYLTMPLLAGETLAALIRRAGRFDPIPAARLVRTLARALEVAHRAGVVHRDLKPSNVMIRADLEPVVMDFGLARSESADDPRLTASGAVLGTPAYLAPELIGTPGSHAEGRCGDVYSLGIILYELLAGHPPFQGKCGEILRKSLTEDAPPLHKARPDLDAGLVAICHRAIARDARQRYGNMEEFAIALDRWLDGVVSDERAAIVPRRAPTRPWPALSRRQWLAIALAGVLLVIALGQTALRNRGWGLGLGFGRAGQATDAWQTATVWNGYFEFRPPMTDYSDDIQIVVQQRTGDRFTGTYSTEDASYLWEIAGEIERKNGQPQIRWNVVRALREKEPRPQMMSAHATGTLEGAQSQQVLVIPTLGVKESASVADLKLQRAP